MKRLAVLVLLAAGCASDATRAPAPVPARAPEKPSAATFDATPYVDPFIGTGGHGHTFPGATVPFGMVQLSPDTRLDGWDGCSGYHHDDEYVYGFSHTHLSGTGCSDYGDILLMPTVGEVRWNNGADGKPGYRSRFSHGEGETAEAGEYEVLLLDSGVAVGLTATTRVGVHCYRFPRGVGDAGAGRVLVDLAHRDQVIESSLSITGDREIRGFRRSRAWAQDQRVYFVARFSRSIIEEHFDPGSDVNGDGGLFDATSKTGVKASLRFDVSDGGPLVVKVGISAVDCDGAARNIEAECPGWDFDAIRGAAHDAWRQQLGKIEVHGGTRAQLRTFYTALYHCCIAPNVFSDVDGRYRGRDGQVHQANGWTQYTVFSLWDTFRAEHPLLTILEPARTNDFINTFLAQYREGGALPVWELAGNETNCMIGYHAVPVIADAYMKGIRGYDADEALKAMVASANRDVRGLKAYREQGFVPAD
jgi:predicted alpha-1,2-mannosidase